MPYSVAWSHEARAQLGVIWIRQTASRRAITAAQARIDQLLAANPIRHGVAVSEGLFAIDVPPLRALYEISNGIQRVEVVVVRWAP
jgi:hypothetical protein